METKDIFERMAAQYDTEERAQIAGVIAEEIRKQLGDAKGMTAMDYGCGTGLVGLELAANFKSLLLVDTSSAMVQQVQGKVDALGLSNAKAMVADFVAEPPPEKLKVDIVFLSQVLLHVKEYRTLLERLARVLRPGGTLVIVDFDKNERVQHELVHSGFVQTELIHGLEQLGYTSAKAHTFYHGKKMFMNEDASLFILTAQVRDIVSSQ